jgi:opacity protein-like surface antigen
MKGIQKLLMLAAVSCLSTSVHAGWEYNWLLGVSGGYAERDGDVNISIFGPGPTFDFSSFNRDVGDHGFVGGVFGGYQARCNRWLFGAELAVDWEDTDADRPFASTITPSVGAPIGFSGAASYDRGTVFGLTARAGYALSKYILFYLRAGAEWSRDKLSVNAATVFTPATVFIIPYAAQGKHSVTRFVGGVGVEMPVPIWDGLSFRAEYDYHSKGHSVNAYGFDGVAGNGLVADAKPRINSVKASLVWNFL